MKQIVAGLLLGVLLGTPAAAQPKASPGPQSGMDVVRLKSGRTVRGVLWQRTGDGRVVLVVRREWLQRTSGDWADTVARSNREQQASAWKNVTERLDAWLANVPDVPRLTFFLRQEADRLKKSLETPPDDGEFLWIELDSPQIAQFTQTVPPYQRIALWGWSEHVPNVETRDVASLAKDLQKSGVKTNAAPPDLSDHFPARPQTDHEWAARQAIIEYTLGTPLDLQGTGNLVFPAGSGKRIDLAAVMPALLERQVQSLLSDLTGNAPPAALKVNDRGWLPSAVRAAEEAGVRGFRVTRVDVSAETLGASITSEFVARVEPDRWVTLWQTSENASGNQARPDQEARIAQDPQVKAALGAVQGLGLGADGQVNAAIRVGAATMSAQQAVDQRFVEFRDRYVKRIDGPPLKVPGQ